MEAPVQVHRFAAFRWRTSALALLLFIAWVVEGTGMLDGTRLGSGLGPIALSEGPDPEWIYAGSWNKRSVVAIPLRNGSEGARSRSVRCPPFFLGFSMDRQVLDFACLEARELCALSPSTLKRIQCWSFETLASALWEDRPLERAKRETAVALAWISGGRRILAALTGESGIFASYWYLAAFEWKERDWVLAGGSKPIVGNLNRVSPAPWALVEDQGRGRIYVAVPPTGELYEFDASEMQLLRSRRVGTYLSGAALDLGRDRLLLSDQIEERILAVNLESLDVEQTVSTRGGPAGLALDSATGILYAIETFEDLVETFDASTLKPLGREIRSVRRPFRILRLGEPGGIIVAGIEDGTVVRMGMNEAVPCRVYPMGDRCFP